MKKLEWVKTIGGIGVITGVGAIVSNAVKENTPENQGAIGKLCTGLGGFVIVGMVCNKAVKYFNDMVDSTVKTVEELDEEDKATEA